MKSRCKVSAIGILLGIPALLISCQVATGDWQIHADQVLQNPDLSKTFKSPHFKAPAGRMELAGGVPGICRPFGMEGYLKEYISWSGDLRPSVRVGDDGTIGVVETSHYLKAITCTAEVPYVSILTTEAIEKNSDDSIVVQSPEIHNGPERFPILSGHLGVCRRLGYGEIVEFSRKWSEEMVHGVALGLDGKIYEKSRGTYLKSLACKGSSSGKKNGEDRGRAGY